MSKTYSMPGWRMGFAAGNPRLITALTRMKSYLDYGAFTPIQVAATAALNGPQDCVEDMRTLYKERRDILIKGLHQAGWDVPAPAGSMFAWAPIPPRFAHLGSVGFSKLLMEKAKVAVAPGIGFGEYGDTHVRIALVENNHRLRQAIRNIRAFLASRQCRPRGRTLRGLAVNLPGSKARGRCPLNPRQRRSLWNPLIRVSQGGGVSGTSARDTPALRNPELLRIEGPRARSALENIGGCSAAEPSRGSKGQRPLALLTERLSA